MSRSKPDISDAGSFAGAAFTSDRLNELHIKDHVPVVLDLDSPSYNAWHTYLALLFRSFRLIEHVDGSVDIRDMKDDDEWLAVDACIVKWLFLTISPGLFNMQNDLSIDEYCTRMKVLADELRDVGMNIDDSVLLTNLLRGLHPDLGQSAANLSLITPTYAKEVTYLCMEEKRLRHAARQAPLAALHASTVKGPAALPQPPRAPAP
ncbi:uncharacterized protein [Aegilops tauschii subsp. strangulata]|uniref:uncharacterized protein n=1 Tax=Aegilops tauschii subsp. strangulata TaxID=200361 RepID=UPI003CC8D20D